GDYEHFFLVLVYEEEDGAMTRVNSEEFLLSQNINPFTSLLNWLKEDLKENEYANGLFMIPNARRMDSLQLKKSPQEKHPSVKQRESFFLKGKSATVDKDNGAGDENKNTQNLRMSPR